MLSLPFHSILHHEKLHRRSDTKLLQRHRYDVSHQRLGCSTGVSAVSHHLMAIVGLVLI